MPAFSPQCRYPQSPRHLCPSGYGHFSNVSRSLVGLSWICVCQSHAPCLLANNIQGLGWVALHHRPALGRCLVPGGVPFRVIPLNDRFVGVCLLTRLVVVPRDRLPECVCLVRLGARPLTIRVLDLPRLVGAILLCVDVGGKGAGWERCSCLNIHGWPTFLPDF